MYDNYNRGTINLTLNVYKIYSKVLEEAVMTLENNVMMGEVQGTFRKDRPDGLETILLFKSFSPFVSLKIVKLILLSLIYRKHSIDAWRDGLFYLLWKGETQGKCWKLLRSLYRHVSQQNYVW